MNTIQRIKEAIVINAMRREIRDLREEIGLLVIEISELRKAVDRRQVER